MNAVEPLKQSLSNWFTLKGQAEEHLEPEHELHAEIQDAIEREARALVMEIRKVERANIPEEVGGPHKKTPEERRAALVKFGEILTGGQRMRRY